MTLRKDDADWAADVSGRRREVVPRQHVTPELPTLLSGSRT
jgi:hypothetical protein